MPLFEYAFICENRSGTILTILYILYAPIRAFTIFSNSALLCDPVLGCGHIGVDYSGIRCTFLRARE